MSGFRGGSPRLGHCGIGSESDARTMPSVVEDFAARVMSEHPDRRWRPKSASNPHTPPPGNSFRDCFTLA